MIGGNDRVHCLTLRLVRGMDCRERSAEADHGFIDAEHRMIEGVAAGAEATDGFSVPIEDRPHEAAAFIRPHDGYLGNLSGISAMT